MFKNQDLKIFQKGNYVKIDGSFIADSLHVLEPIVEIQKKYNKEDTDTFINEVRDSMVGRLLGYELINEEKHGFDGKREKDDVYLEVKQVSYSTKTWGGTFNDTNLEKAEAFKDEKTYLVVGIWDGMTNLVAMIYGQNYKIGEYLEERVKSVMNTPTRSTQTIAVSKLVKDYDFLVIAPPNKNKEDLYNKFIMKNGTFKGFKNSFLSYEEFWNAISNGE